MNLRLLNARYEPVLAAALAALGIEGSEQAVLLALVGQVPRPAGAIAKISGINRAHVYVVLERLVARQLVFSSNLGPSKIRSFSSLSLEALLVRLLDHERVLAEARLGLEQLCATAKEGAATRAVAASPSAARSVRGRG